MGDLGEEFDKIDENGGGQVLELIPVLTQFYLHPPKILFNEFVDWALAKDLDIEDDKEPEEDWEEGGGRMDNGIINPVSSFCKTWQPVYVLNQYILIVCIYRNDYDLQFSEGIYCVFFCSKLPDTPLA